MTRDDIEYYDHCGFRMKNRVPREEHVPAGMSKISRPKPRVSYYHYSNSDSQNALICETPKFPGWFDPSKQKYSCAYSDRIVSWDSDRFREACRIAGGGDQAWAYRLPALSAEQLKKFAQVALDLPTSPIHVRVVHHYNVSSGYSCPTIEAIWTEQ